MAYTHLTNNMDREIPRNKVSVTEISIRLKRARQTIYNVINWLKHGKSIKEYYEKYKRNKKPCGAKKKELVPVKSRTQKL